MTTIKVHPKPVKPSDQVKNPLPQLLQTPSGLALLEMQGTINLPPHDNENSISTESQLGVKAQETPIGRLIFPDYDPENEDKNGWMKRVYLYVGKHQRLTGEVKKLPKAIAIIRRRAAVDEANEDVDMERDDEEKGKIEDLEIVEIVKYKILFSTRPEPVGTWAAGDSI
jgi:chromosome transmission fidelity protein 8